MTWLRRDRAAELRNALWRVLASDLPVRRPYTHAEWAALTEEQRGRAHESRLDAIRRIKDVGALVDRVREAAASCDASVVPVLVQLWATSALQPLWVAAGHALRQMGTTEARAALRASIDEADRFAVRLAVLTFFDEDPRTAYDRLVERFDPQAVARPGGATIAATILDIFSPSSFKADHDRRLVPQWSEPRAPRWCADDRRWIELCVRLRRDAVLGESARCSLRHADPSMVRRALDEALLRESPPPPPHTRAPGDFLSRYHAGEHEAVWRELRAYHAIDGALREEALAVARETMRRVAHDVDRVAERLRSGGWIALSGALRTPPAPGDPEVVQRIEAVTGAPLPPSLLAFWSVVGGVDLVWDYNRGDAPDLRLGLGDDLLLAEMDPLCVDAPAVLTYLFEEWADEREGIDPELQDPFTLNLAPDSLHKANVSGGPPYGIDLPFLGADPRFGNLEMQRPFVEYLRLCLAWGGFPGLAHHAEGPDVRRFVADMTAGLEPF